MVVVVLQHGNMVCAPYCFSSSVDVDGDVVDVVVVGGGDGDADVDGDVVDVVVDGYGDGYGDVDGDDGGRG